MSRDVLTVGSTKRILLLYRGEYSQWVERFMNYLEEQTDGEAMINSIKNGDQQLPRVTQVSISGTSSNEQPPLKDKSMWSDQEKKIQKIDRLARSLLIQGLPNDTYSLIDSNKTAKDLWDALARHMLGSKYGEQDRKAAVLYEYEMFKAIEGELLLDTYIRYLQVINDLKKCGYSKDNCELNFKFLNNLQPEWKQYATRMRQNKNLMDINIDAFYNILKKNQGDVNDAMGLKKKTVMVTSDPLALIAEKTKVSKSNEKAVVSSESKGSEADDFSELKKITALLAKDFNRRKFYSKPTNNNLRTSSASQVKCYNCKKKGHFAKDCKKVKVKDYEYYKTKMLLAKKDKDEEVLMAEDQAWMESSNDSDQEINENMVFMTQIKKVLSDSEASSSSADEKIYEVSYYLSESESESEYETSEYYDNTTTYGLFVNHNDDQEIFHECENFPENLIESKIDHNKSVVDHNDSKGIDKLIRKFNKKIVKCQKRIEKANQQNKDFEIQNKDFQDKYDVLKNQATTFEMNNIDLNEQLLCDSFDENNLFIFDDESVRISPISKMPFRKKPRDSMNVRSTSNSNKSLPRTVHRWLPKMQPLVEPVAKWIPRIVQIDLWIIDSGCSKHKTDVVIRSMTIKKGYYVEGLGHNLFSVGQFCDNGLEVAFRKSTCFIRNEDGVEFLTGDRSSNLYTIALNEVASNSSTCLLAKASSSQSWLWQQQMASKQFSLELDLSNLIETGKSSNQLVSQVSKTSKKDLDDLFQKFYDVYFDSSKIMKSSTMNVETSNVEVPSNEEEVFHESFESFQAESSSSSLTDDVQQKDAYFDASTSFHDPSNVHTFYQPYPHEKKWTKDHPLHKIIGDPNSSVRTRGQLANSCSFSCLLSFIEPANVAEALRDVDWICAMQEELDQFARLK
nr:integrase, catalytic region, zinc finger, CCHC-type, peptidase aspartic, catalytic [Tanacetum cinerariifolium]